MQQRPVTGFGGHQVAAEEREPCFGIFFSQTRYQSGGMEVAGSLSGRDKVAHIAKIKCRRHISKFFLTTMLRKAEIFRTL
ncbi:unknown [Prevotella sp. CAG:1031]|nr:unknown [Prevotella sp. CAG:1031]